MKEVVNRTPTSVSRVVRDESDRIYTFERKDDVTHLYERNKRIRLEDMMTRGQKLPAFGDHVAYSFSMPANWRAYLKQKYPDVLDLLLAKSPEDNIKGAQRLSILEPNWVTIGGNW